MNLGTVGVAGSIINNELSFCRTMIFAGLIIEVIACVWLMGWFYASTFTGTAAVCVICDCLLMSV